MSGVPQPGRPDAKADALKPEAECAVDLVTCGSLEISPDRLDDARAIAALLPARTRVYINHLPRHGLARSVAAARAVRDAGLEPVPHVAARRVVSRAELDDFLRQVVAECDVSKVLLVGGDDPQPLGPFADGAAVLRAGVLEQGGIREIGLPGYPEGHPRIATAVLARALDEKMTLARAAGLGTYIVTQFSFAPARIVEYLSELSRAMPAVPVYVGMAGPTNPVTLLRFAQRCGVSTSLRALQDQGMGAVRLFTHTDPGEQLAAVAHHAASNPTSNVVGVHLFSFGAADKSAAWMHRIISRGSNP